MRDIRPAKRQPSPEEIELYEASYRLKSAGPSPPPRPRRKPLVKDSRRAETSATEPEGGVASAAKARRVRAKAVPVTKIHLPAKGNFIHSDINHVHADEERRAGPLGHLKKSRREPVVKVGHGERKILLVCFGLVGLAALFGAFIFLPTAAVKLYLRTAPLLVDEELHLSSAPAAGSQDIAGTAFFREVALTGSVPVEHTETVGTKATGTAQIINHAGQEQPIKEQSRLVTADGQLFYMQKHAIVPANSQAGVLIEAAEAGTAGNIEPQRLDFAALDETSQQLVFAETTSPLTGGTGEVISVVSEDDIARAQQNAGEVARAKVEAEIRNELPDNWIILEESWQGKLDSFGAEEEVGEATPELNYSATAVVRVMGFAQEAFLAHLRELLEARLGEEFMLFPGPISYTKSVRKVDWEKSEAILAVRVTHTTIPNLNLNTLREKLAGRSVKEAQNYLEGLPGVRSAEIELWPFWAVSIPRIEGRIALVLEPERQP
jgi:hypothetical protein